MSRLSLIVACLVLMASVAHAAQPEIQGTPGFLLAAPTNVVKDLRMDVSLSVIDTAEFTNGLGSVGVVRTSFTADYSIFKLSYGLSKFDWERKRVITFASDDRVPWEYLHDVTLQARLLNNSLGDNWRYWVNGELSSSFEQDFPGAVGVGFDGGIAYDFWDGWMLGATAKTVALSALSDDLFGDVEFGVAVAVSQKSLRNTLVRLGLLSNHKEGAENIAFSIALSGAEKTYRLAPSSPVYTNGYLGLVRSKIGAYLDYSPNEQFTVSVGPEYHYLRQYRLYDSSGQLRSSHNLGNSWGGLFRMLWKF